jgi:hypothetical protein
MKANAKSLMSGLEDLTWLYRHLSSALMTRQAFSTPWNGTMMTLYMQIAFLRSRLGKKSWLELVDDG